MKLTLTLTREELSALYLALGYHRRGLSKSRSEVEAEGQSTAPYDAALADNDAAHSALTVAVEAAGGR